MPIPFPTTCRRCGAKVSAVQHRYGGGVKGHIYIDPEPRVNGDGDIRILDDGRCEVIGPAWAMQEHAAGLDVYRQHRCAPTGPSVKGVAA